MVRGKGPTFEQCGHHQLRFRSDLSIPALNDAIREITFTLQSVEKRVAYDQSRENGLQRTFSPIHTSLDVVFTITPPPRSISTGRA